MFGKSKSPKNGVRSYLHQKSIPTLLEALMTGLVYHQPDDPLVYIEECIRYLKTRDLKKLNWNTFIEVHPGEMDKESNRLSAESLRVDRDEDTKNVMSGMNSLKILWGQNSDASKTATDRRKLKLEPLQKPTDTNLSASNSVKTPDQHPSFRRCLSEHQRPMMNRLKKRLIKSKSEHRQQSMELDERKITSAPEGTTLKTFSSKLFLLPPINKTNIQDPEKKKEKSIKDIIIMEPEVEFTVPGCPVVFILGGPGSGALYYCSQMVQQIPGLVHLHVPDLCRGGSEDDDINSGAGFSFAECSSLSPSTLSCLIMLEMREKPQAKIFIISGYPRHIEDIMDYTQKIVRVDRAILVQLSDAGLVSQIETAAQKSQLDFDETKSRLSSFSKNMQPLGEFLSQKNLLTTINGERNPSDVYSDILCGMRQTVDFKEVPKVLDRNEESGSEVKSLDLIEEESVHTTSTDPEKDSTLPIVFVVAGPGSQKSDNCSSIISLYPGWIHFSMGELIGGVLKSPPSSGFRKILTESEFFNLRSSMSEGNLVSPEVAIKLMSARISEDWTSQIKGFIVDGFPRDCTQIKMFEERFGQKPRVILIDCSELELGRNLGRRSCGSEEFHTTLRKRLEMYRSSTLPMLKALDNDGLLRIIDGDTNPDSLLRSLKSAVLSEILLIEQNYAERDKYLTFPQDLVLTEIPPSQLQSHVFREGDANTWDAHKTNPVFSRSSEKLFPGHGVSPLLKANSVSNMGAHSLAKKTTDGVPNEKGKSAENRKFKRMSSESSIISFLQKQGSLKYIQYKKVNSS